MQYMLKYTLFILLVILAIVLLVSSVGPKNIKPLHIACVFLLTIVLFLVFDRWSPPLRENMCVSNGPTCDYYDKNFEILYDDPQTEEKPSDYNFPGYYMINNGKFANSIPYDKVQELICKSKFRDLYSQHNWNIKSSPHSHIGKQRGYLNWDKMATDQ